MKVGTLYKGGSVSQYSDNRHVCFNLTTHISKSKYLLCTIVGLIFSFGANAQLDSLPVRLAGRVESVDTSYQVPYVHIVNIRTCMGVISDSLGIFKTSLLKNDTLLFRCLGFSDYVYTLPDSLPSNFYFLSLKLSPKSYELAVIDVLALTRKSQFRYDFTNVEVDLQAIEPVIIMPGVTNPNYRKLRQEKRSVYPTYIGGPLAFAYKMSQKSKSLKKLETLYQEDVKKLVTEKKYNMKLLHSFTGYDGEKLLAFFIYLNFSVDYLYKTNDYDIFIRIRDNMKTFEAHYKEHGLELDFIEADSVNSFKE